MNTLSIFGNIVDIKKKSIFYGEVVVVEKKINSVKKIGEEKNNVPYILPGFIDSHVHIESSMLVPSEFARLAVTHGTVGTISDPHEIANVCGMEGVSYMIDNSKTVPFKFVFGAPSCVPATTFETAGSAITVEEVDQLLQMPDIYYLSEMMNFPGVLHKDEDVIKKIAFAKKHNKPIDGHAPGLMGDLAIQYINAGISTDHECFTKEEALHKLKNGMKILIREGSAAKNFEALVDLLHDYPNEIMFCSDDKHPDSLVAGHINELCARAVAKGVDVFKILTAACVNPVEHYKMPVGLLRINDPADFILVSNLIDFNVTNTYINGELVAENGISLLSPSEANSINQFNVELKTFNDFKLPFSDEKEIPVIEALEGQLITHKIFTEPTIFENNIISNVEKDILKIVVVNRYFNAPVAVAFIKNFGLKKGAIASSVAHDSHNIVAVGIDDESICSAVNEVISSKGGISAVHENIKKIIPLPVGGLMTTKNGYEVSRAYTEIDLFVKEQLGSTLNSPFMTLSFMALLVIPELKLSDKGLFDGNKFEFITTSDN